MTSWLNLLPDRSRRTAPAVGGDTGPLQVDDLLTPQAFCADGAPYAALAVAPAGTATGGGHGAVVLWGPGVLTCVSAAATGRGEGLAFRRQIRDQQAVRFHVHAPDGVRPGAWDQPGLRPGIRGLTSGWTRSSLTIRISIEPYLMFMAARRYTGWAVRAADGRPVAQMAAHGVRVATDADPVERSVALLSGLGISTSSYLPWGGE
jgi:hypothetical protein